MQQGAKVRLTFSLSRNSYERLLALAGQSGVSVSWVVRYAVDQLLREQANGQQLTLPLQRSRQPGEKNEGDYDA